MPSVLDEFIGDMGDPQAAHHLGGKDLVVRLLAASRGSALQQPAVGGPDLRYHAVGGEVRRLCQLSLLTEQEAAGILVEVIGEEADIIPAYVVSFRTDPVMV